jgi:hypothetical protein
MPADMTTTFPTYHFHKSNTLESYCFHKVWAPKFWLAQSLMNSEYDASQTLIIQILMKAKSDASRVCSPEIDLQILVQSLEAIFKLPDLLDGSIRLMHL